MISSVAILFANVRSGSFLAFWPRSTSSPFHMTDDLDTNFIDRTAAATRGLFGWIPGVGPSISEAVNQLIPEQRMDRVVRFLRDVERRVQVEERGPIRYERNIRTPDGLALLEEAVMAASRAATERGRTALSSLMSQALTQEEVDYVWNSRLLSIVSQLGDGELLTLLQFSYPQGDVQTGGERKVLADLHPAILGHSSTNANAPVDQQLLAAKQQAYRRVLETQGLIKSIGIGPVCLTELGKLVLESIKVER